MTLGRWSGLLAFVVVATGPLGAGGRAADALVVHQSLVAAGLLAVAATAPWLFARHRLGGILLAGFVAHAYLFSPDRYPTKLALADAITAFGLFVLVTVSARPRWPAVGLGLAAAANTAVAALQAGRGRPVVGLFENAHFGATLSASAAVLLVAWGLGRPVSDRRLRWLAVGLALVFAYPIVGLASRGGLVALVAGMLTIAVVHRRYLLIGAVAVVVALALILPTPLARRVREANDDPYAYQRIGIWTAAARMAWEHPLTGVGVGSFGERSRPYKFAVAGELGRYTKSINHAHNQYLQLVAESGLAGLLLVVVVLGWIVRVAHPRSPLAAADLSTRDLVIPAIVAILTHALFDVVLLAPAVLYGFAALLGSLPARDRGDDACWPHPWWLRPVLAGAIVAAWTAGVLCPWLADRAFASHARSGAGAPLEHAIRLAPDHAGYRRAAGVLAARGGGLLAVSRARREFETAVRLAPFDVPSQLLLARFESELFLGELPAGDVAERALRHYAGVIAADPLNPFPLCDRAVLLGATGRPADALADGRRAAALEPNCAVAHDIIAHAARDLGDLETASEATAAIARIARLRADLQPSSPYEQMLLAPPAAEVNVATSRPSPISSDGHAGGGSR